ncbi:N-acetylglucosamine kinase [Pseudaminobacter sp. 19-2017]|uniref:N-acetylglucosamine kinase n=1 Tax=Pseudaminobacter soli (ex Zhang et al. 2022) TaxID=2831468 RepID=A0A942I834_9HYPH|nr:N-acetylglucosamine kinase [Pseudaminobacter soli]MBS3647766.1 N-acetylglucosamine kinase [Pseudaminobacter soli]
MDLVIGIDGGGTNCRAAVATADGTILGRGKSGPANIRTDFPRARASIIEAVEKAFAEAALDAGHIASTPAVLGLAGSNVGTYREQLNAALPFSEFQVESDALIALEGALGEGNGAIAILGTGTAFMARREGAVRSVGGWGFLVGDQGSGARIGRDLVEQALLAYDGIRTATDLSRSLMGAFRDDPGDVVEFTTTARPGDFAAYAPMVFEYAARGDALGQEIVSRAVADIDASLDALRLVDDEPVCLLGGLAALLSPKLSSRHQVRLRPPLQDAVGGAVSLAARRFRSGRVAVA